MSIDLSDFAGPILGGAVDGNGVSVKVVRNGFEYDTTLGITTGGEFGDLFTVISSLELLGDGNCIVDLDCTGECGGDAVVDALLEQPRRRRATAGCRSSPRRLHISDINSRGCTKRMHGARRGETTARRARC